MLMTSPVTSVEMRLVTRQQEGWGLAICLRGSLSQTVRRFLPDLFGWQAADVRLHRSINTTWADRVHRHAAACDICRYVHRHHFKTGLAHSVRVASRHARRSGSSTGNMIIRPQPRESMVGRQAWMSWNAPVRLMAIDCAHVSGSTSAVGPIGPTTAALLMRIEIGPSVFRTSIESLLHLLCMGDVGGNSDAASA